MKVIRERTMIVGLDGSPELFDMVADVAADIAQELVEGSEKLPVNVKLVMEVSTEGDSE